MNYQDVELLNGSLNNLGSTLMRNRVMEAQERERQDQAQSRQAQIGLEQERVKAETQRGAAAEAHYKAIEDQNAARAGQQDANAQAKAKDALHTIWTNNARAFAQNIQSGAMTPATANAALNASWQNMPSQQKAMLSDHPVAALLDQGKPVFDGQGKSAANIMPEGTFVTLPDGRQIPVIVNKQTGHYQVVEDKSKFDDVAKAKAGLKALYDQLHQANGALVRERNATRRAALQQQVTGIQSQIDNFGGSSSTPAAAPAAAAPGAVRTRSFDPATNTFQDQ